MKSLWRLARGAGEKPEPGLSVRDQLRIMGRILPLLWPKGAPALRARVVAAFALVAVGKAINVGIPILYKIAVDALTAHPGAAIAVPLVIIVGYGLARVAAQGAGEVRDLVFARVLEGALRQMALDVFAHLHRLSLRFHLERQTGGVSRAVERGTDSIEFLLTFLLFNIAPTFLELVLVAGVLWHFFDFTIAATTFAVVIAYAAYTAAATQWRMKFRREMNDQDREANARAIDSLLNYETVKYFTNERHERVRFDDAKSRYVTAALGNQRALSLFNIGQSAILAAGMVLVMLLAGYAVVAGRMTIGDFVMVNAYLLQLYAPLNMLGRFYRNLRQAMTDIEQMYDLLSQTPEVNDAPGARPLVPRGGEVRFAHVDFAYDPRRPILHDVDFAIPAGRTLAIVGPTGSGKTTIARLLFRFYDPGSGQVLIDGQDVRALTQNSLRRAIGVVPQDAVLFNDTVAYNIAYGRPGATQAEIEEAARRAQLADFIARLPDGYATRVGERGLKLSGGEKQRVAIARVVLKNPEILIFDEATSSLDSRTEHEIQKSLKAVAARRTTLVIAHRLSTVVDADEILVLSEGRIVERGRHAALLARDGLYAAMWERQRAADILADVAE